MSSDTRSQITTGFDDQSTLVPDDDGASTQTARASTRASKKHRTSRGQRTKKHPIRSFNMTNDDDFIVEGVNGLNLDVEFQEAFSRITVPTDINREETIARVGHSIIEELGDVPFPGAVTRMAYEWVSSRLT
ncbi:hypothetical protein IAR50_000887 [Cryptococcus sp. DSM 104548]